MQLFASAFPGIAGAEDISPALTPPKARRGRPHAASNPAARRRHIAVAMHRLHFGNTLEQVCNRFDVSPRTVQLWINRVRTYPEAQALFPAR